MANRNHGIWDVRLRPGAVPNLLFQCKIDMNYSMITSNFIRLSLVFQFTRKVTWSLSRTINSMSTRFSGDISRKGLLQTNDISGPASYNLGVDHGISKLADL